ncbi:2-hydroxyisoflavanone dehydratase-like [Spinacia oleracea]|uniref:2-hydroxyisoflavanone dehydratase-like n=1 Tax=Spinacia oleracea TaxID=3562 RepID=A0A9R0INC0_SPIOL|nr:2-hydroxyisoflavanone dehydratase-like [Spinacia oleracea]
MESKTPTTKEVKVEFTGLIRVFNDGSVERLFAPPHVPPTPEDPETGVASKDIKIPANTNLSARLYLPKLTNNNHHIPLLVYFHGGGFCVESAFSVLNHRYMNTLASQAQVIIVSVEYRLAPEHPLPTAYEDCWTALNWAVSLSDPWLATHADLNKLFIGGDSAGGNIVHNIAMRAGQESLDKVKILGAFLSHPYFLDDENNQLEMDYMYKIWDFVYPTAPGGFNNHMINPTGVGAPRLSALGCSRVLVVVAEKDELRDGAVRYTDALKKSGFQGVVELLEVQGEGHCFHMSNPDTDNAKLVFKRLVTFLTNS